MFVVHDRHDDETLPLFEPYEASMPTTFNDLRIVPIASNPARGWWISEIESVR